MKYKFLKRIMLFWTLFIGIGAVAGAIGMLSSPDGSALGMQGMLPYFQVLPFANILFQNFTFSGISLLIVNGLTNLSAALLILLGRKSGAYLSAIFGFTLMLWIIIQFIIFPLNFMSTIYFVFGVLQLICGILFVITTKQSKFSFNKSDYKGISTDNNTTVVYFSRLGYTEKVAYEKADKLGANIYEITTHEKTQGFLGFAWLGRFAMHKWGMPIDEINVDFSKFEKVIIVSPIHDFTVSAPVKEFCKRENGRIKNVEYITVQFRKDRFFVRAFDEMDNALGIKAEKRTGIVCKFGDIVKTQEL